MGCYIWYSQEGTGPSLAVPNVTAHPSTAKVPITALLYNAPLLCGFNGLIKGLNKTIQNQRKKTKQDADSISLTEDINIGCSSARQQCD